MERAAVTALSGSKLGYSTRLAEGLKNLCLRLFFSIVYLVTVNGMLLGKINYGTNSFRYNKCRFGN